ncbi:MAG: radical SAM protein [Candidatus Cloacimonadota bacterium]
MLIYPVFLPKAACPGTCIYCDQVAITGAPALPDPLALSRELEDFIRRNPGLEKQIAFYGGSFTAIPRVERNQLLEPILDLMDEQTTLRISTHPLYIDEQILAWCRQNRIRTIELGIQDFDSSVLRYSCRGYDSTQAVKACNLVQESGFELGVQLMPGLPGWTEDSLSQNHLMLKEIKPQFLRIYPLIVLEGTPLAELWRSGAYRALNLEAALAQAVDYLELCEAESIKLIKIGLPSNLDPSRVLAGPWHPAFGEFVKAEALVRKIILDYHPNQPILLDKRQSSLLFGHQRRYYRILEDRLKTCNINLIIR